MKLPWIAFCSGVVASVAEMILALGLARVDVS